MMMMTMMMMMATHMTQGGEGQGGQCPAQPTQRGQLPVEGDQSPKMAAITILLQHARLDEVLPGVTADDITRFNIFCFTIDYRHSLQGS